MYKCKQNNYPEKYTAIGNCKNYSKKRVTNHFNGFSLSCDGGRKCLFVLFWSDFLKPRLHEQFLCDKFYFWSEEHKRTNIGRHVSGHNLDTKQLSKYFKILKHCTTKLDCLVYEMLYIKVKIHRSTFNQIL